MAATDHWGKIADTELRTGLTGVTDTELGRASLVIELVTGAVYAFVAVPANGNTISLLDKRDTYWMDAAAAYLVPFMRDHPDFFTRMQAKGFSQDGQSVQLDGDSLILPPLVRRALKRLSWRGTRTLLPSRLRRDTIAGQTGGGGYPLLPPGAGVSDYPAEIWVTETRG
jgi:hypothetical protein